MDYSTLKTNIEAWLERDDLTSQLDIFVRAAQRELERKHDFRHMEAVQTGSLTANDQTLATIPARYKNNILFRVSSNGQWEKVTKESLEYIKSVYPHPTADIGVPTMFGLDTPNDQIVLRKTPDSAYSYEWYYRRYSAVLVNDADTNWWIDNADEALMFAALKQANLFIRNDKMAAAWEKMMNDALEDVMGVDITEKFSGGGATVKQDMSNEDT